MVKQLWLGACSNRSPSDTVNSKKTHSAKGLTLNPEWGLKYGYLVPELIMGCCVIGVISILKPPNIYFYATDHAASLSELFIRLGHLGYQTSWKFYVFESNFTEKLT